MLFRSKQKTAYEMLSGDWSSDVCSSDLRSDEDLVEMARYVINNPIRAGLVMRPGDYPLWDCEWMLEWDCL